MEIAIFVALAVLIILVLVLLLRGKGDLLHFSNELSSTRQELTRSKDLISEHTVKTIDTIKEMGATVHKIIQQQEESQKLGQSLKDLLQAPKLRGNYSEAILEEMLAQALPKGIWDKQYTIDGTEKVDAVIKLKDVVVPIDAKFPRDDYQRYMEAQDKQAQKQCWKDYETAVKNQMKSISAKYIRPDKGTTDFAFMFIPSEAIYYETVADENHFGEKSKLKEYAQACKVIPVSPNMLYAHLQTVVLGLQNVEILKSARKLQEGLANVQKNFQLFYSKFEDIGKHLEKASEAYRIGDGHINNYKRKLDSTLELEGFKQEAEQLPETSKN